MNFESFRNEMMRRLAPNRCEGCEDAAVELLKELFNYNRVNEWKRELDYFNHQEEEMQRTILGIMDSIIEDSKRKYELVMQANYDLRVSLWHMRSFFEKATYIPSDVRARRPEEPREEAPPQQGSIDTRSEENEE